MAERIHGFIAISVSISAGNVVHTQTLATNGKYKRKLSRSSLSDHWKCPKWISSAYGYFSFTFGAITPGGNQPMVEWKGKLDENSHLLFVSCIDITSIPNPMQRESEKKTLTKYSEELCVHSKTQLITECTLNMQTSRLTHRQKGWNINMKLNRNIYPRAAFEMHAFVFLYTNSKERITNKNRQQLQADELQSY